MVLFTKTPGLKGIIKKINSLLMDDVSANFVFLCRGIHKHFCHQKWRKVHILFDFNAFIIVLSSNRSDREFLHQILLRTPFRVHEPVLGIWKSPLMGLVKELEMPPWKRFITLMQL
ncbi:uncharacterized protein LOC131610302 [Vicia villosa]|uniref:uncharacterized protein LOC131610302 n=1 Tax=Vicia villosa TaxID=3911 RepID=UPI00273AE369|nr:uncharacterized protein LOC131610302 [Vicia villosa]